MNYEKMVDNEVFKLSNFKGAVTAHMKPPTDFTKWRYGVRKLLKIWYRIDNAKLYWSPLIVTLKEASQYYLKMHNKYSKELLCDICASMLYVTKLKSFIEKDYNQSAEVVEEKMRVAAKKVFCNICATELVYPAYIVYRNEKGQIVERSKPIGIMCLNSSLNTLKKIISSREFVDLLADVTDFDTTSTSTYQVAYK